MSKDVAVLDAAPTRIGRPLKQPPLDAAKRIVDLAAEGRPLKGIALQLGTSPDTLRRWMRENTELQLAFEAGREKERHELHTILLRDARDGEKPNINAIFLLKARHGYRENSVEELGSRVNVIVNVPAAMSRDDYLKTVVIDG